MSYTTPDQIAIANRTLPLLKSADALKSRSADANRAAAAANRANRVNAAALDDSTHKRNTDLLAQMNESWNTNRYILNSVSREKARMTQLDTQAKRDVYLVRQVQQSANYQIGHNSFLTYIVMFTLVVTLLILIQVSLWREGVMSSTAMVSVNSVLVVIYAVGLIVAFRNVGSRRQTHWDHYYFSAKDVASKGKDGSCDS